MRRPALPLPPAPVAPGVKSGETLGRFLEIPNDGSNWVDGVFMVVAGWNALGPSMDEERSSPYAAGTGSGEEGRCRLSIVDGERGCAGGSLMRPTDRTRWVSEGCNRFRSPIAVRLTLRISRARPTLNRTFPHFQKTRTTMADDMDMMAMMGIAGFGKQTKKRELDPRRFEKNRREEVGFTRGRLLRVVLITYSLG